MKRPTFRDPASHQSTELGLVTLSGGKSLQCEQERMASMEEPEAVDELGVEDEELMASASAPTSSGLGEKKRRLGFEQVRALERNFEKDNKLDPDRKSRLAGELGLQPRQVAIWFQNRRARWKTKQLERDFGALRARHDALRAECDTLRHDKDALSAEIRELRSKVEKSQHMSVKQESIEAAEERPAAVVCKDGSSDSDSSVVFNDDVPPYNSGAAVLDHQWFLGFTSFMNSSTPTASTTPFPLFDTKCHGHKGFMDQEGLLGSDELGAAGFFAEEPVSNLSWYGNEGWE